MSATSSFSHAHTAQRELIRARLAQQAPKLKESTTIATIDIIVGVFSAGVALRAAPVTHCGVMLVRAAFAAVLNAVITQAHAGSGAFTAVIVKLAAVRSNAARAHPGHIAAAFAVALGTAHRRLLPVKTTMGTVRFVHIAPNSSVRSKVWGCHKRVTPASSPASHCKQCSRRLHATLAAVPVLLAHALFDAIRRKHMVWTEGQAAVL